MPKQRMLYVSDNVMYTL